MVRTLEGKHPGYFEAILQLRQASREIIDFTEGWLKRQQVPIAKVVPAHSGWDYYLPDNKQTVILGKLLQKTFPGYLEVTATLHTMKKEKKVYRLTILFRGATFAKGSKVQYQGEEYIVKGVSQDILLQAVATGKKIHVHWKKAQEVKALDSGG